MSIRCYGDIKSTIRNNNLVLSLMEKHGCTRTEIEEAKREQADDMKKELREFYKYQNKYHPDPLSVPLRNNEKQWRTVADDFDSRTDFIIIPDKWEDLWDSENEEDYQTISDDIEDFVFTTVGYRSMYDFPTGKMITYNWYFTRTPCGVAVIHRCGIDW